MAKGDQHVVKSGNGWGVRGEGNKKLTKKTRTQKEAIEEAKKIAKNKSSEVVIHGRDGKIRDKDSYGKIRTHPEIRNTNHHLFSITESVS